MRIAVEAGVGRSRRWEIIRVTGIKVAAGREVGDRHSTLADLLAIRLVRLLIHRDETTEQMVKGVTMQGHSYLRTHVLSAEHLLLDLGEAAIELSAMEGIGEDRRAVTLVRQSGLNLVITYLRAGASLAEHAAPGPITIQVLDGLVRISLKDQQLEVPAGRLVAFDAGVRHAVYAREDSALLLTLAEPRDTPTPLT